MDESRTHRNETTVRIRYVQWFGTKLSASENASCCPWLSRVLSEGADAHGRLPLTGGRRTDGTSVSDKPHRRGGESDSFTVARLRLAGSQNARVLATASPGECVRVFAVPHDHRRMVVGVRVELRSSAAVGSILARPARRGNHGSPDHGILLVPLKRSHPTMNSHRKPVSLLCSILLMD